MLARPGLIVILATLAGGCGGDPPPGPELIEGPYALVLGTQSTVFSLAADQARVACAHKPGLKEFTFEAVSEVAGQEGSSLRLAIKDYAGPRTYELEYQPAGLEHLVEVAYPAQPAATKSYKYKLFQFLRMDVNVTYRSHCDVTLAAEELMDRTRYTGLLSCSALWADFDALDHLSAPLNGFADLIARFECDQAS